MPFWTPGAPGAPGVEHFEPNLADKSVVMPALNLHHSTWDDSQSIDGSEGVAETAFTNRVI